MVVLKSTTNRFGGVLIDPDALPADPETFRLRMRHSASDWQSQGLKVVWLQVPIDKSNLIPVAVEEGFKFHHSDDSNLMLTFQLETNAFVPSYASHYIGAGGVVLNDDQELLVVSELYRGSGRPPYYKLPGGSLHQGEHLVDGVIREVLEETGVETNFDALVCFRHWHGYRFSKSDIYFVCRLSPASHEITKQEDEIEECLWMPVTEYLGSEYVGDFNKHIVQAALDSPGIVPTWMDGYNDPDLREFFMPHKADWE